MDIFQSYPPHVTCDSTSKQDNTSDYTPALYTAGMPSPPSKSGNSHVLLHGTMDLALHEIPHSVRHILDASQWHWTNDVNSSGDCYMKTFVLFYQTTNQSTYQVTPIHYYYLPNLQYLV
jgi:hypothetical protein